MLKEAQGINSSAIQDLRAIKEELEVLHERMDLMEKKRDSVSQPVFERVYADYETRQAALEEKAAPLKDVVRSEYSKINALVEQLEEKATKARLVREELEFRKELGEFDEEAFQEKLEECQQELEEAENELAEITGMRDEIAGAFPSADDLKADAKDEEEPVEETVEEEAVAAEDEGVATEDEAVATEDEAVVVEDEAVAVGETEQPVVEKTVVMVVPPEVKEIGAAEETAPDGAANNHETTAEMEVSVEEDLPEEPFAADDDEELDDRQPLPETEKLYDDETAVVAAPPELDTAADDETTVMDASDESAPMAPPPYQAPTAPESFSNGSTAAMATTGRLVAPGEYGSEQVYRLKPSVTSIGRLDINDISVHNGAVSRYHAKIALTEDGFKIYDLDSENGVFVNGERITEHLMNDGDRIELGPGTKRFVFRCP
jgi:hypothetical protein